MPAALVRQYCPDFTMCFDHQIQCAARLGVCAVVYGSLGALASIPVYEPGEATDEARAQLMAVDIDEKWL